MPDRTMLEAALAYLAFGWNVIPVTADKQPRLDSWEEWQGGRVTEREVREWWGRWPNSNIAVVTGAISGLVVVDVDDEAGLRAIGPYLDAGPTLVATTGGGGKHFYFGHPGAAVPNAVRLLPGVDVRADGGMAVVPPSTHRSGRRYRWDDPGARPAALPQGLAALMAGHARSRGRVVAGDWERDVPEGERDSEMTRRAGRLLQAGMPAGEVLPVMRAVNAVHCKPPLPDAQVVKIVNSIAAREAAKPVRAAARPETPTFTVLTQREMLRRYGSGEARWTVDGWLPEASCGLLVAPPGSHKTWLLTALAFAVATGRPFLGRWPVHGRGPVLFIQQEDPWWMLQSRLGRMFNPGAPAETGEGGDRAYELDCRYVPEFDSMPVHWYTDRELRFSDAAVLGQLERKVAEIRPRVVMIDPLYTAADSRDYMAEGAQRMTALKQMRDEYGCSFVVAHHTTVAGSASEDRSSIWGSQFLNAWLEFGWRMPRGDERGSVMVRHFKSCESPGRIRLRFQITDWSFGVEVDNAPASVADRIEEVIMRGTAPATVRALAEMVGAGKSAVQEAVQRLGLERDGGGHYRMPDK
jgi:hypothetical protein